MASMSKKDFEFIAGVIREEQLSEEVARKFANWLRGINPGFSRERFLEACEPRQEIIYCQSVKSVFLVKTAGQWCYFGTGSHARKQLEAVAENRKASLRRVECPRPLPETGAEAKLIYPGWN